MNRNLREKENHDVLSTHREVVVGEMSRPVESARRVSAVRVAPDVIQAGSAKATLASKLNELLDANGLSQNAAAQLLGMPQPKVSAIRNYKLRGISLERLMQALLALNQEVEIIVKPSSKAGGESIRVEA